MTNVLRVSASAYSNTAPLIWSFLYGSERGRAEVILDNAPARSAVLLAEDRVDAALVPVIAYQMIGDAKLIPNVCVGTRRSVRSVCLITDGKDLKDVASVTLDVSSRTSAALTKIVFREFVGREPIWFDAKPNADEMLSRTDCALLIGDPALNVDETRYRKFDLGEVWNDATGLGFVFAMWMTRRGSCPLDLAAVRDEGLMHVSDIAANYAGSVTLSAEDMITYLTRNICYAIDEKMQAGLELYFRLAAKHGLINAERPLEYI